MGKASERTKTGAPQHNEELVMKHRLSTLSLALSGALVALSLVACGGGSDEEPAATSSPAPTTPGGTPVTPVDPSNPNQVVLSGVVVANSTVSGATVCVDLNANENCDGGEPASNPTALNGQFTVVYDSTLIATPTVNASRLIALVPLAARDASLPNEALADRGFVMKAAVSASTQINPLTTLVQVAIAAGQSVTEARANVAALLGIAEAKIDNYLDDPAYDFIDPQDNARFLALFTAATLDAGIPLQVDDQTRAQNATNSDLLNLRYVDADNASFRSLALAAKVAGPTGFDLVDVRGGRSAGTPLATDALYNQAYLNSSGGWTRCDPTASFTFSQGTPSRSGFCGGGLGIVGYSAPPVDVSGRLMTEVVNEIRANPETNSINVGLAADSLLAALGGAVFPPGSSYRLRASVNLNRPILINSINTDGFNQAVATRLEDLIAGFPSSSVTATTGGLNLGLGSGNFKNLRVAFTPTPGQAQFYECDLDATQTIRSNCVPTQLGSYTISTVNGARVMRYSGFTPTVMDHERFHAEVTAGNQANGVIGGGDWVFVVRQLKAPGDDALVEQNRLNATAWSAMRGLLGF
jgi:hypothetical protein